MPHTLYFLDRLDEKREIIISAVYKHGFKKLYNIYDRIYFNGDLLRILTFDDRNNLNKIRYRKNEKSILRYERKLVSIVTNNLQYLNGNEITPTSKVYLERCLLLRLFGQLSPNRNLVSSVWVKNINIGSSGLYRYKHNSCWLDSLLVPLFFLEISYFFRGMFLSKLNDEYNSIWICEQGSKLKDGDIPKYAQSIRTALFNEHQKLANNESFCSNLRKLVSRCLPDVGEGKMYSTTDYYTFICSLFPTLKIPLKRRVTRYLDESFNIFTEDVVEIKKPYITSTEFLSEFDEVSNPPETIVKSIDFDEYEHEVLLIRNTVFIEDMTTTGDKVLYDLNSGVKTSFTIDRPIKETVLDDRYELCAIITLMGVDKPMSGDSNALWESSSTYSDDERTYFDDEGTYSDDGDVWLIGGGALDIGSHYFAYFKRNGIWYWYDDGVQSYEAAVEKLGEELPDEAMRWVDGNYPELFIYRKRM